MTSPGVAGPTRSVRVLIVDDEPDMRLLLTSLLGLDQRFEVAGEAADGAEGLQAYERLRPDVVVLDQRMPVMPGIEIARRILADHPDQAIVLLSAYVEESLREEALALGVRRVIGKQEILDLGPGLLDGIS